MVSRFGLFWFIWSSFSTRKKHRKFSKLSNFYFSIIFVDSARKEMLSEYIRVWYSSRNMTVKIYFYSHYEVIFYWLLTSFCLTQTPTPYYGLHFQLFLLMLFKIADHVMLLKATNFFVDASVILCYFSSCRYDSWMSWRTTD